MTNYKGMGSEVFISARIAGHLQSSNVKRLSFTAWLSDVKASGVEREKERERERERRERW